MTAVDQYIQQFPESVQTHLTTIRMLIKESAPGAEEGFAYGMPAYKLNKKPLVYFGAFAHHIGFYATPSGHSEFKSDLSAYKHGKGSVQFPLDQPIPYDLIKRMVEFRVSEISATVKPSGKF